MPEAGRQPAEDRSRGVQGCESRRLYRTPSATRAKLQAQQVREEDKAREQGLSVLDEDEAVKAYRHGAAAQHGRGKRLDLDEPWYDQSGNLSVRDRLKGRLDTQQVLVHDMQGRPHYLVPRKAAQELIEADAKGPEKKQKRENPHVSCVPSEGTIDKRAQALALTEIHALALANLNDLGRPEPANGRSGDERDLSGTPTGGLVYGLARGGMPSW